MTRRKRRTPNWEIVFREERALVKPYREIAELTGFDIRHKLLDSMLYLVTNSDHKLFGQVGIGANVIPGVCETRHVVEFKGSKWRADHYVWRAGYYVVFDCKRDEEEPFFRSIDPQTLLNVRKILLPEEMWVEED